MNTGSILDEIIAHKRSENIAQKKVVAISELEKMASVAPPRRSFVGAITAKIDSKEIAIIAELKKASPSKGIINTHFKPIEIAKAYATGGACCLSILTDQHFFLGHNDYLKDVRACIDLPILRKDFILDEYQVIESRAIGADCILLIVAALAYEELNRLYYTARELDLDVLIEVHNKKELDIALSLSPDLIGINNRNLKTFDTTLDTTFELLQHIPKHITIITESGIRSANDINTMLSRDVRAFLVGEMFMRATEPGVALNNLLSNTSLKKQKDEKG